MTVVAVAPPQASPSDGLTPESTTKHIQNRRSQELVIGLCGAIGSGVKALKETLSSVLTASGYTVHHIRISDHISDIVGGDLSNLRGYERYKKLQDAGDVLRKKHKNTFLAEVAINAITVYRDKHFGTGSDEGEIVKTDLKVAYIIDQLKHPDEISLLRTVYPNNFYQIGLIRTEKERRVNLSDEQIAASHIDELIRRDRKADDPYGQQVEKALYSADYFIRNLSNQSKLMRKSVSRFVNLIHGQVGITPTHDEIGLFTAYSESLKSACLSRQVGAAIMDDTGQIIATGCNDVPKYKGGLYDANSTDDFRCIHQKRCSNDKHKQILEAEIESVLMHNSIPQRKAKELANSILNETKAKSIIEYSRAIHAEMDAITSLARKASCSSQDKTLYCTTYPCHNCARHIVAAGIIRVVYIEPYEKSLAIQLHGDAITDSTEPNKVVFEPFEGVAPNRYDSFFKYNTKRKDSSGRAIDFNIIECHHVDPQYLDSYHDYEYRIAEIVNKKLTPPPQTT
ncbi:deoxycytidylate deaminase [Photobacterium ganghwense]|uniref:Deoxycytidylate deaminase n=1 Tax=Photobacterium ganghwense TaxID=320778 RepID=A0A0J1HDJ7_9GAMM|nr:anti-phage dCTP deaminase [Photobacterium ganghwense]KLV09715.1 deoxycytidylate deaminase [Photobacterium ganghwense]PSU04729.1 deoxycytidylate deaminase [Photobacterium ganghwense]